MKYKIAEELGKTIHGTETTTVIPLKMERTTVDFGRSYIRARKRLEKLGLITRFAYYLTPIGREVAEAIQDPNKSYRDIRLPIEKKKNKKLARFWGIQYL